MAIYGTRADAATYHAERGNSTWSTKSSDEQDAALLVASDYIDTFRSSFPGKKTGGRAQEREWPRIQTDGVSEVVDATGEEIGTDVVPVEVEYATYEAALLHVTGVSLTQTPASSTSAGSVTRKRVKAGPIETETVYAESSAGTGTWPSFQKILQLLENVRTNQTGGATVRLLRV